MSPFGTEAFLDDLWMIGLAAALVAALVGFIMLIKMAFEEKDGDLRLGNIAIAGMAFVVMLMIAGLMNLVYMNKTKAETVQKGGRK